MKRRKLLLAGLCIVLTMGFTGCGDVIPELSESEQQMVTDYAVDLILKYDTSQESRLVELSAEDMLQTDAEDKVEEPEVTEPPKESIGMDPIEDTVEIPVGGIVPDSLSIEEVLGFDESLVLEYQDYQVVESYETESAEQGYVSVEAGENNKLLVVRFLLSNLSAKEQHINMIAMDAEFSFKLGGMVSKKCQLTLLENDLSTYFGDVSANGNVEVVLIAELAEDLVGNVTALEINVGNEEKTTTIRLF